MKRLSDYIKEKCLGNKSTVFEAYDAGKSIDDMVRCFRSALTVAPMVIVRNVLATLSKHVISRAQPGMYYNMPLMTKRVNEPEVRFVDKSGNEIVEWDTYDEPWRVWTDHDVLRSLASVESARTMYLRVIKSDGSVGIARFDFDSYMEWRPKIEQQPVDADFPQGFDTVPPYTLKAVGRLYVLKDIDGVTDRGWWAALMIATVTVVNANGNSVTGNGFTLDFLDNVGNICSYIFGDIVVSKESVGLSCTDKAYIIHAYTDAYYATWAWKLS